MSLTRDVPNRFGRVHHAPNAVHPQASQHGVFIPLLHSSKRTFGALLCAALSLAHERPRRLVIGHVLLRGHARNGAADHVESQVLQRFEAEATFTHVELLAALLVFALTNQVERPHAPHRRFASFHYDAGLRPSSVLLRMRAAELQWWLAAVALGKDGRMDT